MFKEIRLLSNSIKESRVFYNEYKNLYSKEFVNFQPDYYLLIYVTHFQKRKFLIE